MANFPLILNELKTQVTVDFALANFSKVHYISGTVETWCVYVRERGRGTDRQRDQGNRTNMGLAARLGSDQGGQLT